MPHPGSRDDQAGHHHLPADAARAGEAHPGDARAVQAMVLLASWCALRFGELTELRRRDVDIDMDAGRGVIRVERGVVRTAGGFAVGAPKSDAGRRRVAIPPHLLGAVQEHLACHVGHEPTPCCSRPSTVVTWLPSTLNRHFYAARSGRPSQPSLPRLTAHRSGVGGPRGATLAELMGRLGHAHPRSRCAINTSRRTPIRPLPSGCPSWPALTS